VSRPAMPVREEAQLWRPAVVAGPYCRQDLSASGVLRLAPYLFFKSKLALSALVELSLTREG